MTDHIPGAEARRAALKLLDAVLRRGQPLESALDAACVALPAAADRAFAHAMARETLRHLPDLDDLIDSACTQRLPDDAKARMVLRLMLTQALALDTPPHAVVATALPLLEGGPKRLVHGVFGTLMRAKSTLRRVPMLPGPVEARWGAAWGTAMLDRAREAMAAPPPLDLALRDPATTAHWAEALGGTSLLSGHIRLAADARVPDLPGFDAGAWWVQNLSATVPARLLGAGDGRRVLDLCAAPGGKTLQLASQGWQVTAVEKVVARAKRIEENLARTQLHADVVTANILTWQPDTRYDAILLDAPCSSTGIFARHPDVLHRVRPRDIAEMASLQAKLLARAADWLNPGATLIYATCSLEPQEGEAMVAQCAEALPHLRLSPIGAAETEALAPALAATPNRAGTLRILPQPGVDGFFVARFQTA